LHNPVFLLYSPSIFFYHPHPENSSFYIAKSLHAFFGCHKNDNIIVNVKRAMIENKKKFEKDKNAL